MRRWLLGACAALLLGLMVTAPASGWEITKTKTKTLSWGTVTFTSAFKAGDGEIIPISIISFTSTATPPVTDVNILSVTLKKVSPKPNSNPQCPSGCSIDVSGTGDHSVDVTLHNTRPDKSKFHLWVLLSTGDYIGVNVAFGR